MKSKKQSSKVKTKFISFKYPSKDYKVVEEDNRFYIILIEGTYNTKQRISKKASNIKFVKYCYE